MSGPRPPISKAWLTPEIDLVIARRVIAVRNDVAIGKCEVLTQPGAEQVVDAEAGTHPQIGNAARGRDPPLVIEVDVVARDVVERRLVEVELRGLDALAMRGLPRGIQVGAEIVDGVVGAELDAADQTIAVIEGRENDRRPELTLVDQVLRLLVVAVDAERQGLVEKLLLHAEVIVIGALGDRRGVLRHRARRHGRGARELRERAGADELERRRREVARIAAVQRRIGGELPDGIDARAELAAAGIGAVVVVAQAVIDGEGRQGLPFILQIDALNLLNLSAVLDDGERHIGSLRARRSSMGSTCEVVSLLELSC